MKTLSQCNAGFALDLYQNLASRKGNLFFSPYSLSAALAMTYAGARENTAAEMARVLHFPPSEPGIHAAFGGLAARLTALSGSEGVSLYVANAIWPQDRYPFLADYLTLIRTHYGVSIIPQNFRSGSEAARERINAWVADRTEEKIQDLIPPGILDSLTRLVLTNAVYFKGAWAFPFDPGMTRDAPFFRSAGDAAPVPMMERAGDFGYAEFPDFQMLEMPYAGEALSMIILLPGGPDAIGNLEGRLSVANLGAFESRLVRTRVQVFLPRFEITCPVRLDTVLKSLGMADAFDINRANFNGMDAGRGGLSIQAVLHKAFVSVYEEGTEAAGASAVVMGERSLAAPAPVFRCDHPFMFYIRDRETGALLFMGRLSDPGAK